MELQFSMERRMLNRLLLETAFLRDPACSMGKPASYWALPYYMNGHLMKFIRR